MAYNRAWRGCRALDFTERATKGFMLVHSLAFPIGEGKLHVRLAAINEMASCLESLRFVVFN